ncbi:hypothetical protein V1503_19510 [Bacillus sp. SCS-151]|uniref:hypothetical protein n=1 Tax=Nanhaiella sioensis TaxID=3115293 RepID=UPI00397E1035
MKGSFFEQFKRYLLDNHKYSLNTYIPYYETLLQAKKEISEILEDSEKYYLEIRYESDKSDGYTDGSFEFHFYEKSLDEGDDWESHIGYYYVMELLHDERMWGYCECTSEDEGYDPIRRCCGNGCDWTAPSIKITKMIGSVHYSFKGVERDMWEHKKKWKNDEFDHEEIIRKNRLKCIEQQIEGLEKEKLSLINQ